MRQSPTAGQGTLTHSDLGPGEYEVTQHETAGIACQTDVCGDHCRRQRAIPSPSDQAPTVSSTVRWSTAEGTSERPGD